MLSELIKNSKAGNYQDRTEGDDSSILSKKSRSNKGHRKF